MNPFDIDDPTTYPPVGAWMWHVHHECLCEPLTEPLSARIDYIQTKKPKAEIETRLRWMTPVLGTLPAAYDKASAAYDKAGAAYDKASAAYVEAWAAYDKAWAAYDKAWAAFDKAGAAFDKASAAYVAALQALHAVEHPGCPWNGRTIFP